MIQAQVNLLQQASFCNDIYLHFILLSFFAIVSFVNTDLYY